MLTVGGLGIYLSSGHPSPSRLSASNGSNGTASKSGQGRTGASGGAGQKGQQTPKVRVLKTLTAGLVGFGPFDDRDPWTNDPDDQARMLQATGRDLAFIPISAADLTSGTPLWTADQMSDGSDIFIYIPTGDCLTALTATGAGTSGQQATPGLAHCDLGPAQQWWPLNTTTASGATFSQFATADHGECLTAGAAGATATPSPTATSGATPSPSATPGPSGPPGAAPSAGAAGLPATLSACGPARTKSQEIAFFWSA